MSKITEERPVITTGAITTESAVNRPEFPDGDPRRNWPKLEDPYNLLPKVLETDQKAREKLAAQRVAETAESMTIHQANGYVPHVVFTDEGPKEYWIKAPKIAALTEFYHRMGAFEKLPAADQATPEGMRVGLEAVMPLLRLLNEDGTYRKVSYEEAAEDIGIEDIGPVVSKAFPQLTPGAELAQAGLVDPKAPRQSRKTGRPSTA